MSEVLQISERTFQKYHSYTITIQILNFFSQVETCRETLMTLSLTDAENANTDPTETVNNIVTETSVETKSETELTEETGTVNNDDTVVSRDLGNNDQGVVQEKISSDCDGETTTETSADDQPLGDGTAMSTDDSDYEVGASLPQTPTSPDENANSKH